MKYTFIFCFALMTFLIAVSCNTRNTGTDQPKQAAESIPTDTIEPVASICIWDRISLRESPTKDGKWLTAINLGEKLWYLGESIKDSTDNDRIYARVRLSDNTEGWVSEYGIVKDAEVGAMVLPCPIYKRPDLLTETDKRFEIMEMVAISEIDGKWVYVTGQKREKSGWVLMEKITTDKNDVAVGIMAGKALSEVEDESERMEIIKSIIRDTPYPDAVFIAYLQDELARYRERNEDD